MQGLNENVCANVPCQHTCVANEWLSCLDDDDDDDVVTDLPLQLTLRID